MKKVLNILLACFAFLGLVFNILYLHNVINDKGLYTNSTATYAQYVTDPKTGEKKPAFETAYYQNVNGSGKQVVDFKINCYIDYKGTAIYPRGYQLVINTDGSTELYYCDGYDNYGWPSMHKYDETNKDGQHEELYYIEMDGKIVGARLDGTYQDNVTRSNNIPALRRIGNVLGNFITFRWTSSSYKDMCNEYITTRETFYYTYEDLLLSVATMMRGQSYGTGSFQMPLVDMGDYIHIYETAEDGEVSQEPLGNNTLINAYYALDCYYSRAGMVRANQSLFGSVAGDNGYNVTGIDYDIEYYKYNGVYYLTEKDFVTRYDQINNGFYYTLSSKTINELKSFNPDIYITFDISKLGNSTNVLGFDYYALYGIKVKQLTINSNSQRDFTLLIGSLQDTGLTTENVVLNNVKLINTQSGVEL